MRDFFHSVFVAYAIIIALIFAPLVITLVCDKAVIPFILWLHRRGILKATP